MNRGDVVLIDFPFSDRSGSKLRPALVVQADHLNRVIADTVLALITKTIRSSSTEVLIDLTVPDANQSGLLHSSVVDCKNLITSDKRFIVRRIGTLPSPLMALIDDGLKVALGLK